MFNLPVHASLSTSNDVMVPNEMPSVSFVDIGLVTGSASLEVLSNRARRPWNKYWCPSDVTGLMLQQQLAWGL